MNRTLAPLLLLALTACTPGPNVSDEEFTAHLVAKQIAGFTRTTLGVVRNIAERHRTAPGQPLMTDEDRRQMKAVTMPLLDLAQKAGSEMASQLAKVPGGDLAAYPGCKAAIVSTLDLVIQAKHVLDTGARADAMLPVIDATDAHIKACGDNVARVEPTITAHLDGIRDRYLR